LRFESNEGGFIVSARPSRSTGLLFLSLIAVLAFGLSGIAAAKPAKTTSGTAWVGVTHTEGSDVYVAGDFKDSLLGRGVIVYVVQAATGPEPSSVVVQAKRITLYTKRGSLTGTGQATQTLYPDGSTSVSDGTFKLKKGTGAYKGHKFTGTFAGPYADGVYTFDYDAKYK
jgi:hypothetical protein